MSVKKIIRIILLTVALTAAYTAWLLFGSSTHFDEDKKSFYINTGSTFNTVLADLTQQGFVKNTFTFRTVARLTKYDQKVKPGKYVFEKGSSVYHFIKRLQSGVQTPVNFVITKLRTKEDLARRIATNFECDSLAVMRLLNNNDSLAAFSLDTNTVMTAIIPNTYSILWTTPAARILKKLYNEQQKFWNETRKAKAKKLQLTPAQVYTLASIVEEETNMPEDKGKIASVYINRIKTGMKLAADPTVKFAMKDFGLKRIYHKHLLYPSPYNTYQVQGLPPGPICTPLPKTIDAVLDAPDTDYLFFVAKADFRGYSNFAATYAEHQKYAKEYQDALNILMKEKELK